MCCIFSTAVHHVSVGYTCVRTLKGAGLHRHREDSLVCKIFFGIYGVEKMQNNA